MGRGVSRDPENKMTGHMGFEANGGDETGLTVSECVANYVAILKAGRKD